MFTEVRIGMDRGMGAVLLLGAHCRLRNAPNTWWDVDGVYGSLWRRWVRTRVQSLFCFGALWGLLARPLVAPPKPQGRCEDVVHGAWPFRFRWKHGFGHPALDAAWQMNRLAGERPNEKGWEDPRAGWTGRCGDEDAADTVTVVVAGGSSVAVPISLVANPKPSSAVAHKRCAQRCQSTFS